MLSISMINPKNTEKLTTKGGGLSSVISQAKKITEDALNKTSGSMGSRGGANLEDINLNDILNQYNSAYAASSGGGPGMIDISNMLRAYEQEAAANRDVAKQQYDTTRNDLLTSLKRFQEDNAAQVANQQKAYLSNQASLESAIAQADRQNRISAAARGLGGSGLQQLAQLQNLLSQGQNISDLATGNQQAMDALRLALSRQEEDTDTKIANALTNYNNALSTINSALASNKANIEYQARENAAQRAASARASAAAQEVANRGLANEASQAIAGAQEQLQNELKGMSVLSKKELKSLYGTTDLNKAKEKAYENAQQNARTLLQSYQLGTNTAASNTFLNNLLALYNNSTGR